MYSINDSFIGYHKNFQRELFSGSDRYELYQENLKTKPIDWYYRNSNIEYTRNSVGHRTKEISDTNLDNYILSVGCSMTEGIGIEHNKTYTHVLANMLDCDYYNMGIGGHSLQTAIHNTIVWFNKIKKKPKLLIVQMPPLARFPIFKEKEILPGSINYPDPSLIEFAIAGDQINYWNSLYELQMIQFMSFDVPVIEVLYNRHPVPSSDEKRQIYLDLLDCGRDNHPGIESNYNVAKKIYDKYKLL